jgi:arginyl-tRNA synthetase
VLNSTVSLLSVAVSLASPHERALAVQLLRLGEALDTAAADYAPHAITGYLWDLAKSYSGFFQNCPVLKAPTPELRDSRLLLGDLTGRTIRLCLDLLGIRAVERIWPGLLAGGGAGDSGHDPTCGQIK